MTYREILELYKQGKLAEKQQKEVEADIEKQDAISEYLFEEAAIPEIDSFEEKDVKSEGTDTGQEERFLQMVNQSIRRAFIKMGTAVGTIVLVIVLLFLFAFPGFVSLFYYNPGKTVGENDFGKTNQISLDMAVYTELFVPGYYRNRVEVDSLGYGKYDISINQKTTMNGLYTNLPGMIKRNKMTLYNTNIIQKPVDNVFIRTADTPDMPFTLYENEKTGETEDMGAAGTVEEAKEELQSLDEKDYCIAYITLEGLTDYEEFVQWFQAMDLAVGETWCSVYPKDPHGNLLAYNIGFMLYPDGYHMCYDEEKYPDLCHSKDISMGISDKETAQTHFLSMLQYMSRQQAFLKMMGEKEFIDYAAIVEAVKRDGLQLNGFAVVAQKEELLALFEEEKVCYIYTVPMR